MPGQNTIEYLTIQHCRERIQLAIKNDLVAISGRMVERGWITIEDSTDMINPMYNTATLANRLILTMLLPKIQENEGNYQVFINDILGANSYFYNGIIDHLKTVYEDEKLKKSGAAAVEQPEQTMQPNSTGIANPTATGSTDPVNSRSGGDDSPDVGVVPKYGEEKLREIKGLKAPSQKLKEGDEHYEAVQKFAQEVVLLIQTVNENETWAALEYMEGPKFNGTQLPKVVNFGKSKVRLGMFSQYKAALVKTEMGANCEKKLSDALSELPNVKGIIALGIAWGCKGKCELADVLVATKIVGWNEEKWTNGKLIARDKFIMPMSDKFKEAFAELPGQWGNFERAKNDKSKAQKALIISTVKLINDDEIRRQIIDQEPEAKGGEMEGHVLVQKIQRDNLHVALIKGISDFADGNKHDEWQLTAAMAAVDYAKYMLDETDPDDLFD